MSRFDKYLRHDLEYFLAVSRENYRNVTNNLDEETLRGIVDAIYEGLPIPKPLPSMDKDSFIKFDRAIKLLQRKIRKNIETDWGKLLIKVKANNKDQVTVKQVTEFISNVLDIGPQRFDDWTRFELIMAIIGENIELRDECSLSNNVIKNLALEIFNDRKMPKRIKLYKTAIIKKMDTACRKIQKFYRRFSQMNAIKNMVANSRQDRYFHPDGIDPDSLDQTVNNTHENNKTDHWTPPILEKAINFSNWNHPRIGGDGSDVRFNLCTTTTGRHCTTGGGGEQCDLWEEGKWSEFGSFGPGVSLYFKFMKWVFWVTLILSCFSFVPLVINIFGPQLSSSYVPLLTDIARTTVGNMANSFDGFNSTGAPDGVLFPFCADQGNIYKVNCMLDKSFLGNLYTWLDLGGAFLFIIAVYWLDHFEKIEEADINKLTQFASSFAIKVSNLPHLFTEAELVSHFEKFVKYKIAAIYVAYDNEDEIETYKLRGKEMAYRRRKENELKYYDNLFSTVENGDNSNLVVLDEKQPENLEQPSHDQNKTKIQIDQAIYDKIHLSIEKTQKKIDEINAKILQNKKNKRARGYDKLKKNAITNSKNNADIENDKKSSDFEYYGRPVCVFITFEEEYAKGKALEEFGFRSLWNWLATPENKRFKGFRLYVDSAPEPSNVLWENLQYNLPNRIFRRIVSTLCISIFLLITILITFTSRILQQVTRGSGGTGTCPSNWDSYSDTDKKSAVGLDTNILHCYCDNPRYATDSICYDYLQDKAVSTFITLLASFIVSIINYLIGKLIKYLATFEKHHSITRREKSLFIRLFALRVINMGIIFLINQDRYYISSTLNIVYTYDPNLSTEWYYTVGVSVILVQIQMAAGNFYGLFKYFMWRRKQELAKNDPLIALSQSELNKLYLGGGFELSSRYANTVSIFLVCYMYSTGMPIMLLIGSINFYITYWVDKFLFIKYYRIPPRYTTEISKYSTALFKYILLIHLIMALWTLCNSDYFVTENVGYKAYTEKTVSGSTSSDFDGGKFIANVTQEHTLPILIFFLLCLLFITANYVFKELFVKGLHYILHSLLGCPTLFQAHKEDLYKSSNAKVITYSQAIRFGRFKNLASYNILHNPKYQSAFDITSTWSTDHKHIESVIDFSYDNEDGVNLKNIEMVGLTQSSEAVVADPSMERVSDNTTTINLSPERQDSFTIMQQLILNEILENKNKDI